MMLIVPGGKVALLGKELIKGAVGDFFINNLLIGADVMVNSVTGNDDSVGTRITDAYSRYSDTRDFLSLGK